jgi:hypothetical protein
MFDPMRPIPIIPIFISFSSVARQSGPLMRQGRHTAHDEPTATLDDEPLTGCPIRKTPTSK